jgi:hypothetical protein
VHFRTDGRLAQFQRKHKNIFLTMPLTLAGWLGPERGHRVVVDARRGIDVSGREAGSDGAKAREGGFQAFDDLGGDLVRRR